MNDEGVWLNGNLTRMWDMLRGRNRLSDRTRRLFDCACCRLVWDRLDRRGRTIVKNAERYADGLVPLRRLEQDSAWLYDDASHVSSWALLYAACDTAHNRSDVSEARARVVRASDQAALIRDIFGNPCRPVPSWSLVLWNCRRCGTPHRSYSCPNCQTPDSPATRLADTLLSWNDGCIRKMAQVIYADRSFDLMPQLADALQEAGCDNADVLDHCLGLERCPGCRGLGRVDRTRRDLGRGDGAFKTKTAMEGCTSHTLTTAGFEACRGGRVSMRGPHVRGCWVLDMLLGKE